MNIKHNCHYTFLVFRIFHVARIFKNRFHINVKKFYPNLHFLCLQILMEVMHAYPIRHPLKKRKHPGCEILKSSDKRFSSTTSKNYIHNYVEWFITNYDII